MMLILPIANKVNKERKIRLAATFTRNLKIATVVWLMFKVRLRAKGRIASDSVVMKWSGIRSARLGAYAEYVFIWLLERA